MKVILFPLALKIENCSKFIRLREVGEVGEVGEVRMVREVGKVGKVRMVGTVRMVVRRTRIS